MTSVAEELDKVRGHIAGARTIIWRVTKNDGWQRAPVSVKFLMLGVEETLATSHRLLDLVIGIVPALVIELSGEVLSGQESNRGDPGGPDAAGPARPGDDVPPSTAR